MIDWLRFYVPLDTESVISDTFPKPILAWYGKTNTTIAHVHQSIGMGRQWGGAAVEGWVPI